MEAIKYYIDKNGNRFNSNLFTKAEAKKASDSLVNCKNCIDCKDCENCTDCFNCAGCFDCTSCNSCQRCYRCTDCTSMALCQDIAM